MNYIRLQISMAEEYQEILIAELYEMGFTGFQQEGEILLAAMPLKQWDEVKREQIHQLATAFWKPSVIEAEVVEPENWNRKWEKSIKAQRIGPFLVKPSWLEDEPLDSETALLIDPKMSFGTGNHATTSLMLEWIPELVKKNDHVLDAGTGTGILGIAAAKCGAASVFGFDTDEWSKINADENAVLNGVENICRFELGSVETIPSGNQFDLILANTNRNVLITLIPELLIQLNKNGKIILSGLLTEDEEFMLQQSSLKPLKHMETRRKDEWTAMCFGI